ncbi:MAG TPA: hypothetical protein VFS20_13545 [Longimicrobium sp.]|nr:hypothetical protein [Longimicrobium sp.]
MSSRPSSPAIDGTRQVVLGGRLSLEWKLPLLVTGFMAAGLAALLAFTYTTLAARAHLIVRDRLHHAVREIAATADAALAQRATLLRTAAADASVQRVLAASRAGTSPSAVDLAGSGALVGEHLHQPPAPRPVWLSAVS